MASNTQIKKVIAMAMASGIDDAEIAERNGVTVSYLSQLRKDVSFDTMLASLRGEDTTSRRNNLLDGIQDELLEAFAANTQKFVKSPRDAMNLFKLTNEAKREPTLADKIKNSAIVVVQLPTHLTSDAKVIEHKTNENNEIIEVDGRPLITQTSEKLLESVEDNTDLYEHNTITVKPKIEIPNADPLDDIFDSEDLNLEDF